MAAHGARDTHHTHIPVSTYCWVFLALLVLLGLTVFIATFHLGAFNIFAAMAIATIKAVLVVMYFMQVKRSIRMIRVYAAASAIWLAIGIILVFADYLTRLPLQ